MKCSQAIVWSIIAMAVCQLTAWGATELPKEELLWPGGVPDKAIVHTQAEKMTLMVGKTGKYGGGAQFVSVPTLMVLPAPKDKATRAAVVVYPGGGYRNVVLGKEGMEIARRLNEMGITAVVVKYRTFVLADPNARPTEDVYKAQLPSIIADGERAVRIIRSRATELGIDPNKIGVMGFSAGAYLAGSVMLEADEGRSGADDPVERVSSRPDFTCMVYSGLNKERFDRSKKVLIGPCFLATAANDDKVKASDILESFEMLQKAGVPVELHVYQSGGHGFGIGRPENTTNTWTDTFSIWLKQNGFSRK